MWGVDKAPVLKVLLPSHHSANGPTGEVKVFTGQSVLKIRKTN